MNSKKQIVLIMTDTQRRDMLGCYGNPNIKTPNLDKLASEGIRFTSAYTCQPVCGPARSAIFTGTYPHSNGSWGNSMALGDNVKTIGQRLSDNGFHTAYIGKWHLDAGDYFGKGICPNGWDPKYWYDMRNYLEEMSYEDRMLSRTSEIMKNRQVTENFTFGHKCSNKAMEFLKNHKDENFLLVISYDEPHEPGICPEPYSSMYNEYEHPKSENIYDTLKNKPQHQKVWAGNNTLMDRNKLKIKRPNFFGCNSFIDYEIGRVIESINNYAPDALIIYTSDHGDHLQSHCLNNKGASMYEENIGIPLIIKYPKVAPKGAVCSHVVSHIDITPTIMEIANLPIPKILEGKSLVNTLKNPLLKTNDTVFIEFSRYEIDHDGFGGFQPIRSVYDGRYKLVINLLSSDELYDLKKDPAEMNNLICDYEYASIRNSLHDKILNWMNDTRDPFRGYYWERRPWREDAKPATWDYTGFTRQREHEEYEPRQLDYNTGIEMTKAVRKKIRDQDIKIINPIN